ncbi:hypothetical protein RAD10_42370, partial [Bradyrhizobium sp. 23AC]
MLNIRDTGYVYRCRFLSPNFVDCFVVQNYYVIRRYGVKDLKTFAGEPGIASYRTMLSVLIVKNDRMIARDKSNRR